MPSKHRPATASRLIRLAIVTAFVLMVAACAADEGGAVSSAQHAPPTREASPVYIPKVGQDGKDVMWVPTHSALVEKMLDMADVSPGERLVDLGSGDGITVIMAARRGADALGIEFNPDLVAVSRRNAEAAGVAERARFVEGDIFKSDFSDANVVTLFLLPELNLKLRPALLAMKPGTRVVSNTFDMGDWLPDQSVHGSEDCAADSHYCIAYLWVVPTKVAGLWALDGRHLRLQQDFQLLQGHLGDQPISAARVDGRQISFTLGQRQYVGDIDGDEISGLVDGRVAWQARRLR
ncbi:MAG: methyltransferase domain-containing protein [Pseudomonadota bacterium]|nr:methyltransferase domain-containing protein [Pseudomonadota bacterium]